MFYITNANDFYNHCLKIYVNNEHLLEETIVNFLNNNLGLNIKYKYNNEYINSFNFTLFENNLKWNKLSTGFIKTDVYTNNLKIDIILNKNIFIDFINILEITLKTMLSRNKYLNNYEIIIKKTIVEKEDNFYFNNIKFNYFRKDNHKNLSTKVYIKKKENDKIETALLTDEEINNCYINKGFYILPIVSLKSLFIKKQNKKLNIYPRFFLNTVTLYNKYNNKKMSINNDLYEKSNIDEQGY